MIPAQIRKPAESKRKPNRKALFLLVLFFLIVMAALFLTSPLSKIRSIEVVGNNQVAKEDILKSSGISIGMNFWQVKPKETDLKIREQVMLVSKADVAVHFPGKVVIAVAEKPVAAILILKGGTFYCLLSDGTVFDKIQNNNGTSLPLLISERGFQVEIGKRIADSDVQKFCEQIVKVDRSVLDHISDFQILKGDLWSARSIEPEGFELRFPPGDINMTLNVFVKFWKERLTGKHSGIIYIYGPDEAWYQPFSSQPDKKE